MPTEKESGPATNGTTLTTSPAIDYTAGLRRRRAATYRLPQLECGCVDPWTCRCATAELTTDSAIAAADHLDRHGLAPLFSIAAGRNLWRGGHRDLAVLCIQQVSA